MMLSICVSLSQVGSRLGIGAFTSTRSVQEKQPVLRNEMPITCAQLRGGTYCELPMCMR
jgi:hypothetical protein